MHPCQRMKDGLRMSENQENIRKSRKPKPNQEITAPRSRNPGRDQELHTWLWMDGWLRPSENQENQENQENPSQIKK